MRKYLFGSEPTTSPRLQRRWLALAALTVLGSVALLALALAHLRTQTLQTAEQLNTALVRIVAEQTTRTLQTVDQRLELAATALARLDGPGERNPESVGQLLRQQFAQLPFVLALRVLDAQGNTAFSSQAVHANSPLPNQAPLFAIQPGRPFELSLPRPGSAPGQWLMEAARPVLSRDGTTTGFLVATIDARHFDALWSQINLGADGSLALLRRDGTLLLRMPFVESAIGKNFSARPVFQSLLPAQSIGNSREHCAIDDVKRLFSYSTLAAHPDLVVIAGRSESHVLERWQQWTLVVLWVWGSASAIILALGIHLDRAWRHLEREQRNALDHATRYQDTLQDNALKMQALSRRIINAQEAERRRVAHELHDELGQSLTAIKINLQSGARFKARSAEDTNLENIRIVEDALQQVRSLALALRPSILDNLGLVPALGWMGKLMAQRSGFAFQFAPPATTPRLTPELETTCFRIVQEALTNVARHAQASQVSLTMQYTTDTVTLTLTDNGVGMDWDAVRHSAQNGSSAGVLGMLERANLVGASLQVQSRPGAGCTLVLQCPLSVHPECD